VPLVDTSLFGTKRLRAAERESALIRLDALKLQARSELRVAEQSVTVNERMVASARLASESAAEALRLTQIAYRAGATCRPSRAPATRRSAWPSPRTACASRASTAWSRSASSRSRRRARGDRIVVGRRRRSAPPRGRAPRHGGECQQRRLRTRIHLVRALIRHRRSVQLSHTFLRLPEKHRVQVSQLVGRQVRPSGRELLDAFRMRVQQGQHTTEMRAHERRGLHLQAHSKIASRPSQFFLGWLRIVRTSQRALEGGLNRRRRVALVFTATQEEEHWVIRKQCQSSLEMVRVMLFVTLQPQLRRAIPLPHHFVARWLRLGRVGGLDEFECCFR
jgi:hypothetical protein